MDSNKFESLYSSKVKAGRRRTYFFDVRKTKGEDYYITLTESTRKFNDEGYERHKIFLYKEDFNRFLDSLTDVINHVKTELMPDYDYDEFAKRYQEDANAPSKQESTAQETPESEASQSEEDSEDEMSW